MRKMEKRRAKLEAEIKEYRTVLARMELDSPLRPWVESQIDSREAILQGLTEEKEVLVRRR